MSKLYRIHKIFLEHKTSFFNGIDEQNQVCKNISGSSSEKCDSVRIKIKSSFVWVSENMTPENLCQLIDMCPD